MSLLGLAWEGKSGWWVEKGEQMKKLAIMERVVSLWNGDLFKHTISSTTMVSDAAHGSQGDLREQHRANVVH